MSARRQFEERRLRQLLQGEVVESFGRWRDGELLIQFASGKRLYIDWMPDVALDFSVAGGLFPKSSSVKRRKRRRFKL